MSDEKEKEKISMNYTAQIPIQIIFDKNLDHRAAYLYGIISALTYKEGYCWASNSYFAELFEVHKKTISKWISQLVQQKYLKVILIYKTESKEVKERRIYRVDQLKILPTPYPRIDGDPLHENTEANSKSYNSNSKELQRKNKSFPKKIPSGSAKASPKSTSSRNVNSDGIDSSSVNINKDPILFGKEEKDPFAEKVVQLATDAAQEAADHKMTPPFSIPRPGKQPKYFKDIKRYIDELRNGSYFEANKFNDTFLQHIDKTRIEVLRGQSEEEVWKSIEFAIVKYSKARNNPDKYEFINPDRKINLGTFMYERNSYSGVDGISPFLKYYCNGTAVKSSYSDKEELLKVYFPEKNVTKMYSDTYHYFREFTDIEKKRAIQGFYALTAHFEKNYERLAKKYRGKFTLAFPKRAETLLTHYFNKWAGNIKHPYKIVKGNDRWKEFFDFIWEQRGVDLDSKDEKAVKETEVKIKKATISDEEIERRMNAD